MPIINLKLHFAQPPARFKLNYASYSEVRWSLVRPYLSGSKKIMFINAPGEFIKKVYFYTTINLFLQIYRRLIFIMIMSETTHKLYIGTFTAIVLITFILLIYNGLPYYRSGFEEKVYHPDHNRLKPSGMVGHGLGVTGSFFIIVGVATYMARKRYRVLSRIGILKHWLEFHIFLCTLGPVLILFHTAFKFGGLVAVSFWSMLAVILSGIIGRFIYIQIPRSIEGKALSLNEVRAMKRDLAVSLRESYNLDNESYAIILESVNTKTVQKSIKNPVVRLIRNRLEDRRSVRQVSEVLKRKNFPLSEYRKLIRLVRNDISLNRKIESLDFMQNLFGYWHVIHLPFALVMLVIMVIHVVVALLFGYRWIF